MVQRVHFLSSVNYDLPDSVVLVAVDRLSTANVTRVPHNLRTELELVE